MLTISASEAIKEAAAGAASGEQAMLRRDELDSEARQTEQIFESQSAAGWAASCFRRAGSRAKLMQMADIA